MSSLLVSYLLAAMLSTADQGSTAPPVLKDCRDCPEMVILPAGTFAMGSPPQEQGRYRNEALAHPVRVGSFAMARTEVTRGEFAAFVDATGFSSAGGCYTQGDFTGVVQAGLDAAASWRSPGFAQTDRHPVVCVSWHDAQAYAQWLSRKTGHRYRLPTEAQWEYAARGGTLSPYPWGDEANQGCAHMNGGDLTLGRDVPAWAVATKKARDDGLPQSVLIACEDGAALTSEAGRYTANGFGLHDMIGNAWEWAEDCGDDRPAATLPQQPSSTTCQQRRTRGGSWNDWPIDLRTAVRKRLDATTRRNDVGFRLVREIGQDGEER